MIFLLLLSFHPPRVNRSDGRETSRDVGEVSLVLEDVLGLGPDPVHLATVCQVRLVAHYEGQRQQGNNRCRLLGSEHRISVTTERPVSFELRNPNFEIEFG